ncbi:uncharacterized protein EV422DRAFT_496184 [Fimicolochytrium jonesii]|uniref:uncharacterized protein n=1 Tax=Fimicolochytrium jonesii TaxID=1396493 RepID=UPI0022FDF8DC|nr:uncharacterized protein EV422DRAFT_496184 [Fimicolochytrium jonesii]KAI8820958.1 hypothetical protein EV422DRAFT_496184 [Fimicolochytrium jonesii]
MNRKEVAVAVAPAAEPEPERSLNLPFGESEAEVVVESPLVSRTPSSSSSLITKLPTELICAIAMKSGFFTAINLMHTCRTLRTILSAPEAWATYYNPDMSDEIIENTLSVTTKLTQFDHLVFGTWSGLPGTRGDEGQRREGEDLFFEHRAFDTDFDFLGGISAKMSRGGMLKIQFFEHRTTLPCYLTDIQTKLNSGELAPTHLPTTPGIPDEFSSTPPSAAPLFPAATLAPPTGLRIPHTCPTCTYFDTQTIHKSTSLLDHNMFAAPTLLDDAITWVYTHLDNRRRVKVKVHAYQGPLGYVSWRDLPMVHCNEVRVAGRALRGWAWEFWRDVVERV